MVVGASTAASPSLRGITLQTQEASIMSNRAQQAASTKDQTSSHAAEGAMNSKANSTPGPWRVVSGNLIQRVNGQVIARAENDTWHTDEEVEANARRIVACVNACER